ncbi:MAG TPA: CmcJ/NvfI family oxidoreductase [Candidatus Binataceae bacterium]|nr:CmcJ/NvfI family oxidoreductase [Candidatus Binataceae bacterium]
MEIIARKLDHVEAQLNYAADSGAGRKLVSIHDARAVIDQLSLEQQGFILRRHKTAVRNFFDEREVRAVYYPEVEQLLKEGTGAARAVAFEHDVRSASKAERAATGARQPVKFVHDDYTEKSAPERVRLYLPEEAEALLKERYAVINVWRPIRGPVLDTPLAVCDAESIVAADLIPTEEGVKHQVYRFDFNPNHRWYYFSAMTTNEVLLFKCFDSNKNSSARITAHSAFDLPATAAPAPARQSIEVRALVFFPHVAANAVST